MSSAPSVIIFTLWFLNVFFLTLAYLRSRKNAKSISTLCDAVAHVIEMDIMITNMIEEIDKSCKRADSD